MANIKQVQLDQLYEIEALHFIAGDLDTPTQWKAYIDQQVATGAKIQLKVDSWNTAKTAPATAASGDTMGKIFLCANEGTVSGTYAEFVTIQSGSKEPYTYTWEMIGTTETDLSKYAKAGTYTTTGSGAQTAKSAKTGITITSSGGHTTSAATFTGTYSKAAAATGQNVSVSSSAVTGGGGAFAVAPKFTGTEATLTGSVSGASLNSISYAPQGGISGSQTVSAHSHTVNVSKDTKSVLTGITSVSSNGSHSHTVDSHEHGGSGTASVINSFSGGSIASAGTITAVKSVTGSITGNIYGFSSSQGVLSAATVNSNGVLSFATATASAQNGLSISTTTATVNTGYRHTAASLNYTASAAFAFAATGKTLTTASAGAHSHTVTPSAATISYVTGATTSSAGGVTINGTNFSFNGTEASLQPTFADQGSVSITYTPSGAVSAVSIGNHSHSYEKPVAHTHSITLTSADVAVSGTVVVSNHTHTITDPGHTHSVDSHTHNVTISN